MQTAFYDVKSYDRPSFQKTVLYPEINWQFYEFRLNADTAASAKGSQAVCIFVNDRADRPCLEVLKESGVGLITLRCAGFNNVDVEAAKALGIAVTRVPAYSPHAVAEHTVGLLLTLNRKIHRAYNRVREHNFSLNGLIGFDVAGKTVGIVGTGKIGKITAEIFRGMSATVLASDPFPDNEWASRHGVRYVELDELFSNSDIVSLHAPLSSETFHLLNESSINQLKDGVFLINTSRGKLIDTTALIEALKQGKVSGVALDVYEEEEGIFFEDHTESLALNDELTRLLSFPNVLITSHQAFLTHEALAQIAQVTTENIIRFRDGKAFLKGTHLTSGN